MQNFKSKTLWQEIERRAKKCSYKVAAVAYCTSDDVVSFGAGDLLVTDASDAAIRSRQTDRRLLRRAYRKGAELYSCPGLHAKVLIFDDGVIIGSANLSQSSRKDLIEAGLVTNNPTTVAEARAFVEQLAGQSDEIDEAFLKRIDKLKLKPFRPFSKRRTGIKIQDQSPGQLWIAGLHESDEDPQDSEQIAHWKKTSTRIW